MVNKIEKIKATLVEIPLKENFLGGTYEVTKRSVIITQIYTKEGLVSEVFCGDDRFRSPEIVTIINDIYQPYLIGQDATQITKIWNNLFNNFIKDITSQNRKYLRGTLIKALSCIDIALWDILGKIKNLPVIDLLGRKKDKLKVSTIGGYYQDDKGEKEIIKEMELYKNLGYKACKFKIGKIDPTEDYKRVVAAKSNLDSNFDLMVDANCGYSVQKATEFVNLSANLELRWLEEPCHWWDDINFMSEVRKNSKIKIAAGQGEINHYGIKRMIEKKAIDVCNLDSFVCGGITEWKRAANFCNKSGIEMAHHEEASISAHLLGSEEKATYVEIFANSARDPFHERVWLNKPEIKNGFINTPKEPGLGVILDWDQIVKYS